MITVKLSYIASELGWRHVGPDVEITQVVTDSRQVDAGDCFIALYGENFDAHQFLGQVIVAGATSLIVKREYSGEHSDALGQLIVDDTREALGQLGALIARLSQTKKVAITGSCGKTTVKEMLSAICAVQHNVLSTAGNFNNDIGVPLTLLRLTREHDIAVIELGANHVGEIDYSGGLVVPDVAIITNIGAAHLEGFGGIDGVVEAKSEIFNHLALSGTAIFDGTSNYASRWQLSNQQRKTSRFYHVSQDDGLSKVNDVYAAKVSLDEHGCAHFMLHAPAGELAISLALPGLHNVANALAASAAALAIGVDLADVATGLANMQAVNGRLNVIVVSPTLTVIDDTYNANASSITAAIELLAQYSGDKILVLGDMGELGEYGVSSHQSIGPVVERNKIDILMTFGSLSHHYGRGFQGKHLHFNDKAQLNHALEQQLIALTPQKVVVLAKGSRSTRMEEVVEFIKNNNKINEVHQC